MEFPTFLQAVIQIPAQIIRRSRKLNYQLEAVSKPPNADHRARKVHESIIHCDIEFMSNEQSSKVTQPCKSAFDGPSSAITPKLATVLRRCSFSTFTMGTNQIPLRMPEPFTKRIAVVSTVGNQRDTTVFWARDLDKHAFDELDFRWGRACGRTCQRYSLAISHHHPLGSLSTLGFPNVEAPFLAGAKLPSTKTSSQSSRPC